MSNVIKLPTAATTYFTVAKHRHGWAIVLVTPNGSLKPHKTNLSIGSDKAAMVAIAKDWAATRQREYR